MSIHPSCDLRLAVQQETECMLGCGTWGPAFAHLASHRYLFPPVSIFFSTAGSRKPLTKLVPKPLSAYTMEDFVYITQEE